MMHPIKGPGERFKSVAMTTPAHTDAVEIAQAHYHPIVQVPGWDDYSPRINHLAALIEPKLRERDEEIARLAKLFDQERLDNIEMRRLLAEMQEHHAEGLRHVKNQFNEITDLRAQLAAEQHRYSELHVTCTALESEANALRSELAAAREDGETLDFVERLDATIESDGGCGDGPSIWTCSWATGNRNEIHAQKVTGGSVRESIRAARQTHEEGKG